MLVECPGCHTAMGDVKEGSKLRKGWSVICEPCLTRFKAADMAMKLKPKSGNPVEDFMDSLFKKKP